MTPLLNAYRRHHPKAAVTMINRAYETAKEAHRHQSRGSGESYINHPLAVARIVAEHMSRTLGQQVVVENVSGAGGTTGATRCAQASPDGYTIMMGHMGTHGAAPAVYPDIKYDPRKDFAPIGLAAGTPLPPVQGEGTACRHSKDPLMSPSAGRPRAGPYASASCMSSCTSGRLRLSGMNMCAAMSPSTIANAAATGALICASSRFSQCLCS